MTDRAVSLAVHATVGALHGLAAIVTYLALSRILRGGYPPR